MITSEHTRPQNCPPLELKSCENCTRLFTRQQPERWSFLGRTMGQRYCLICSKRMLLPEQDDEYREMMPEEAKMKHSSLLPVYDDSLVNPEQLVKSNLHSAPSKKNKPMHRGPRTLGDWMTRLRQAFGTRGPMTAVEILEITGHKCSGPPSWVLGMCRQAGINVQIVASLWPRLSCMGPAPKLYYPLEKAIPTITGNGSIPVLLRSPDFQELPTGPITLGPVQFTPLEFQIGELVSQGWRNKAIAEKFGTTEQTIKNYMRSILDKTGQDTRLEVALWWHQRQREERAARN